MQKRRPVMLVVLDGWGWREDAADNAVRQARRPTFDQLLGRAARTPSCARRAATSACRRARWAIPRSAISTSAPAASVMQDLPRIKRRHRAAARSTTRPRCTGLIETREAEPAAPAI